MPYQQELLRGRLEDIQTKVSSDPHNITLLNDEQEVREQYESVL